MSSMSPEAKVEGKQSSLFPAEPVIKCFVIQKLKTKTAKNRLLNADWHRNLPQFQGARPDHVRVESLNCCFPRELVSFDQRHVTRSPPIGKRV